MAVAIKAHRRCPTHTHTPYCSRPPSPLDLFPSHMQKGKRCVLQPSALSPMSSLDRLFSCPSWLPLHLSSASLSLSPHFVNTQNTLFPDGLINQSGCNSPPQTAPTIPHWRRKNSEELASLNPQKQRFHEAVVHSTLRSGKCLGCDIPQSHSTLRKNRKQGGLLKKVIHLGNTFEPDRSAAAGLWFLVLFTGNSSSPNQERNRNWELEEDKILSLLYASK